MNSVEFHAHITKIVKRCKFPCAKAEERAIRDTIFLGMNSTKARDKAINLMNEEGKELTVDFLMQQLEIEDCNAHHKSLSQLDSTSSVNFAAYDHRQDKGRKSKKNTGNGKDQVQNKSEQVKINYRDTSIRSNCDEFFVAIYDDKTTSGSPIVNLCRHVFEGVITAPNNGFTFMAYTSHTILELFTAYLEIVEADIVVIALEYP